ncbi:MAG TPA: hypothetical protein VE243_08210 [Candidatus Acidoferrum sp.]|nr:hypothetical protein [Candidatus Acidoferrum sp.]
MKITTAIGFLTLLLLILSTQTRAAGSDDRMSIFVDCHCQDAVGGDFCAAFKDKLKSTPAYQLVDKTDTYGIAVHLWCIDLFAKMPGVDSKLSSTMSAVSVAFTLYSDRLPGEVYEDSSVFRVGKDATDQMAQSLLTAVGQIVTANKSVFEHIRATPKAPAAAPTQRVIQ